MEAVAPILNYRIPIGKRLFDIFFSASTILLLSPVFITIIVLMKILSKGPVFYKSKRVGTNYKIFDFYKFRSMEIDADQKLKKIVHLNQYKDTHHLEIAEHQCEECLAKNAPCSNLLVFDDSTICEKVYLQQKRHKYEEAFIKISNDPRVTHFGKFLRNSSLDELPQLLNVLKGDMSIVGNRPLPLYEAEKLTTDQKVRRFMAPSGITGLWQVIKRGNSNMSAEERVVLDIYYAKRYSMKHDLYILLRTIPAMFQKDNV
jgi:lipopolysaccharide/colanic/teichoic acid biosynthesis glycosyltransferase